jgi:Fe-S cluster assembly protein SufD
MMPAALQRELAAHAPSLPGDAATLRLREAALARFATAGLPSTRRESWRYTDLQPLGKIAHTPVPQKPDPATVAAAAARLEAASIAPAAHRLVFVDGYPIPALGAPAPFAGLEIGDLETHWQRFENRYPQRLESADHPLLSLNTAFVQHGAWLRVPEGVRIEDPIHLVFIAGGGATAAPQPRVIVELARGARLTVVEEHLDVGDAAGWLNTVTQIEQGPESRLAFYRVQQHGAAQWHTGLVSADLAAGAQLAIGYVDLGGRLIRNDIDVRLREPGAAVELFGVFVAGAGQHVDEHTRIDHLARETRSEETFRGIVGRRGRGVFNGKVVVHRDAQRIDARQSNDNLLLGEHAEIDTKPELEIYADDVKCSHGSTVGELDSEQLFYLRSRGVPELAARELLIGAFAAAVLERIESPALREQISAKVADRLRAITAEVPR